MNPLARLPTETVDRCIVCDGGEPLEDRRFASLLGLTPRYGVSRCAACDLAWLSPRPTAEGYRILYTDELYFGGGTRTVEAYRRVAQARRIHFRARLRRIGRELGDSPAILDVGAATGEFVDEARRLGHRAEGVEPSSDARRRAREELGIELWEADLDELPGGWDAIHLNHTLEHLPDPASSLRTIRELLVPGGLLVIEVPQQLDNDLDQLRRLGRRLMRRRAPELSAYSLHHTYFFTATPLLALVRRHGFEPLRTRTSAWSLTPLTGVPWLTALRNLLLGSFLFASDRLHGGGTILELWAQREEDEHPTPTAKLASHGT